MKHFNCKFASSESPYRQSKQFWNCSVLTQSKPTWGLIIASLLLGRAHQSSLFPHGIAISTGIQKHVNEEINKSKGCDGSGSGGRLNRPLALLQIKNRYQKMQHDELSLSLYSLTYTSDSSKNYVLSFLFQTQTRKDHKQYSSQLNSWSVNILVCCKIGINPQDPESCY